MHSFACASVYANRSARLAIEPDKEELKSQKYNMDKSNTDMPIDSSSEAPPASALVDSSPDVPQAAATVPTVDRDYAPERIV